MHWFIMIFLQSARFFQQSLKYVCPAFSAPLSACTAQAGGFRSDVQRTPRLNTLEGNPVQLGRGGILFHVPALGEQIVHITNFGILHISRNYTSIQSHHIRDHFLRSSKAAQTDNSGVSARFLPGTDIRDPGIDGLLDNTEFFR